MSIEIKQRVPYADLDTSPVNLLRRCVNRNEKLSRTEWVPIFKIVDEAMVVDEPHADELYRIMKEGGFGQTQGVFQGAVLAV